MPAPNPFDELVAATSGEEGAERSSSFAPNPFDELVRQTSGEAEDPEQGSAFIRGLKGGVTQLRALGNAAHAVGAEAVGLGDVAERNAQQYLQLMEEAAQYDQVPFEEAFESPGKFITWAAEALGEQVPNVATVLMTGGIGGITAKLASRRLLKEGAEELAKKAASQWARRGFALGAFTGTTTIETGGVGGEQISELGRIEPWIALGSGASSGAMELVPWVPIAGLMGMGPLARNAFVQTLREGGLLSRVAGGGLIGLSTEAATETLQELSAIAARRFVDENYDVLGPEAASRILEAAVTGGVVGGAFGGVSGGIGRARKAPSPERGPGPLPPEGSPGPEGGSVPRERALVPISQERVQDSSEGGVSGRPEVITLPGPAPARPEPEVEAAGEIVGPQTPPPALPLIDVEELELEPVEAAGEPLQDLIAQSIALTPEQIEETNWQALSQELNEIQDTVGGDYDVAWQEAYTTLRRFLPDFHEDIPPTLIDTLVGGQETEPGAAPEPGAADLEPPGPLSDEGYDRMRSAGFYVDPWEEQHLATQGTEGVPLADIRRAMSYNLPGGPPIESIPLEAVEVEAIQDATRGVYDLPLRWRGDVWPAALAMRHAVANGEISPGRYQEFLYTLETLGLAVRPAELVSPYTANLPRQGSMSVEALWSHFEHAQDDKVILARVMEDLNPRGLESEIQEIDMGDFWDTWKRYVPSLELVILGKREGSEVMHRLGLGSQGLIEAHLPEQADAADAVIQTLQDHHELWIWRNPLIQFSHEIHAPGVYGNYAHVRVSRMPDGTPLILEVQGDYDIHRGDWETEQELNERNEDLLVAKEQVGHIRLELRDIEQELARFEGIERDEMGMVMDPEAGDLIYQLEFRQLDRFEQLKTALENVHSLEQRITELSQNYRFSDLNRGGNQAQWILQETLRALKLLGEEEVLLANQTVIGQAELWASSLYDSYWLFVERTAGLSQQELEAELDVTVGAWLRDEGRMFRADSLALRRESLDARYPEAGIGERLVEMLDSYKARAVKNLKTFLRTGRLGKALDVLDTVNEARAVDLLFLERGAATFGEDRPAQLAASNFFVSRYNNLLLRYKRLLTWAKENHEGAREELFHPAFRDDLKVLRIPLPEKWEDPTEPILLFRDNIPSNLGLPPRADASIRDIHRQVDEGTGEHC